MRDKERYHKDSYAIKNGHIYCTKDTYEIFQQINCISDQQRLKILESLNFLFIFKIE